jgi:LysR family transcriptional regulator, carnitine catabolism transcriptional activator
MNVTLRQLRAFVAVAQLGGFTPAAQRLHLTQSALSVLVRELERELGIRLFDRTTRMVRLTDAGREFHGSAEKMLLDLEHAVANSRGLADARRGRVAVAATPLMSSVMLPRIIAGYMAAYPGVTVVLKDAVAGQIRRLVHDGAVDFGIGTFLTPESGLVTEPLMVDTLVLACPRDHALAARARVRWRDLAGLPFIALPHDNAVGELVRDCLKEAGTPVQIAHEVAFLTTVLGMVEAGMGVSVLPSYGRETIRTHNIAVRRLVEPTIRRETSLITRRDRSLSPAAAGLQAHMKEYVRRLKTASA